LTKKYCINFKKKSNCIYKNTINKHQCKTLKVLYKKQLFNLNFLLYSIELKTSIFHESFKSDFQF